MRPLDVPTPIDAAELRMVTHVASSIRSGSSPAWPKAPCIDTSSYTSTAAPSCLGDIALLVTGEFRSFLPPWRPRDNHWKGLDPDSVWNKIFERVVQPNGPADLFIHSWRSDLAHQLIARLPTPPCASICEEYGEQYVHRVLARYSGFRYIHGFLRFNNSRETPHIVDFFYKRFAALQLLERFERKRRRAYKTIVLTRPDVVMLSRVEVPATLEPSTIYVHGSDHHHDSTDTDTNVDPIQRGMCGQMPNDWFAYGDRKSMQAYLSAFPQLPSLHSRMRATPGSCDWWRCHNYRYNFTFLNNAEAYLGFHLRSEGLRCRELQEATPRVRMVLPPTRRRDWGPGWERPPEGWDSTPS